MSRAPLRITSTANDRVKDLVRLRQRRERDRLGLTLVEEPLVIARARAAGHPCREVWYCPEREATATADLRRSLQDDGIPAVEVSAPVMDRIAYRERSEGLLLVVPQIATGLADLVLPQGRSPLVVVSNERKLKITIGNTVILSSRKNPENPRWELARR